MISKIRRHVSEADMAAMFGVGVWALRAWRKRGYGPPIVKFGRKVFYREEDVQSFIDARGAKHDD